MFGRNDKRVIPRFSRLSGCPLSPSVAIVSDFYLDYVGGAQTSMLEQKASLAEAGHEVYLVANVRKGTRIPPSTSRSRRG